MDPEISSSFLREKKYVRMCYIMKLKTSGIALWTEAAMVLKGRERWRGVGKNVLEALYDRQRHSATITQVKLYIMAL